MDPAIAGLVMGAVDITQEQSTLAKAMAALKTVNDELTSVQISLNDLLHKGGVPAEQLDALQRKSHQLRTQVETMTVAIGRLPQLIQQRDFLRGQQDDLGPQSAMGIARLVSQIEDDIEFAAFQAQTGKDFQAFCEVRVPELRMEIGTLRSRLADGGQSPADRHNTEESLKILEEKLISFENTLAQGRQPPIR